MKKFSVDIKSPVLSFFSILFGGLFFVFGFISIFTLNDLPLSLSYIALGISFISLFYSSYPYAKDENNEILHRIEAILNDKYSNSEKTNSKSNKHDGLQSSNVIKHSVDSESNKQYSDNN